MKAKSISLLFALKLVDHDSIDPSIVGNRWGKGGQDSSITGLDIATSSFEARVGRLQRTKEAAVVKALKIMIVARASGAI
jgi:hypothetical protein